MVRRVMIYGGTGIPHAVGRFAARFAAGLLHSSDRVVIVTGGFRQYRNTKKVDAGSVDANVIAGATAYATEQGKSREELNERLEAWLPDPRLDRQDVDRFGQDGGRVVQLPGATAQARRFAMVHGVDAIVTMHGEHHTRAILDLAFTFDNPPTFPLPFTGSISQDYWRDPANRAQVIDWFSLTEPLITELDRGDPDTLSPSKIDRLVPLVVDAVGRAIRRSCLVLMPFDSSSEAFYDDTLKPLIERANFRPVRLDREIRAGHIPTLFLEHLRRHDAIVVDLTGWRPNVVYELGAAHVSGMQPFLLRRDTDKIPFYFTQYMRFDVQSGDDGNRAALEARLSDYLNELRGVVPS